MGLLDGFPPGDWGGLLGAPIKQLPPKSFAPLFVPLTEAAYGEPAPGDPWTTNPSSFGRATGAMPENAAGPPVQLAQYAPAIPGLPLPMPGGVFRPGTAENDEFTRNFIDSNRRAGRAIGNAIGGILHNENADENAVRPPAGSRPINETPWSGDHTEIKGAVVADPDSDVRISPTGEVWAQHPDGSWTNHGPVTSFTGSGKPRGRRGKDRDRW